MTSSRGIIYLLLFSLLTGSMGYFVRLTTGLDPSHILFARAALATAFIGVVALLTGQVKHLKIQQPRTTLIMGVAQAISIYLFFAAITLTTLANAYILTYTAPIFSAILALLFLKEKITKNTIIGIVLALSGVILVSNPGQIALDPTQAKGSLYALLGGFFYAVMAISSKSLTQTTKPIYAAFWQYAIITVLTAYFGASLPFELLAANSLPLLYIGIAAGGIAFLLYMEGVKLVRGQTIQVVTMAEVVVASLAGALLLGEALTPTVLIGGLLILGGVLVSSRNQTD